MKSENKTAVMNTPCINGDMDCKGYPNAINNSNGAQQYGNYSLMKHLEAKAKCFGGYNSKKNKVTIN